MVNMLHRKMHVNDGFGVSIVVTSTQDKKEDKEHGKSSKNSKMWNCKHCWTKMIRKHKNNSLRNWALVNKLFPIGYERWKRFKRPVDGDHMSWTKDKYRSTQAQKPIWHFACSEQKEIVFALYGYRGWKVDLFWESQAQNYQGQTQAHHPHRPQDRIALAERCCTVFCGTRRPWSVMGC